MKFIATIILILLNYDVSFSQVNSIDSSKFHGPIPRKGMNADKPGHYDFVVRINNAIVDRNEFLIAELFITGYGQIENSKLVFYPSIDIVDTIESSVSYELSVEKWKKDRNLKWGEKTMKIPQAGIILDFQPIDDLSYTYFLDFQKMGTTPQIMTKTMLGEVAPVVLKLKIRKNASSGNHFLNFAFTYYNGKEWLGSSQQIPFTIQNAFQKNDTIITWLVIAATLLTILASGITIYEFIKNRAYKKQEKRNKAEDVKPQKKK